MARTTVTLDPDVEALLSQFMAERGLSFKQAINDSIRQGLQHARVGEIDYSFPTYDLGQPTVDLTRALQVASDLEVEETARELERGR